MLTTTDIKNLSIALEALSHIPRVEALSERIESLLDAAVTKAEESVEKQELYSRPPQPPPYQATTDDGVPF